MDYSPFFRKLMQPWHEKEASIFLGWWYSSMSGKKAPEFKRVSGNLVLPPFRAGQYFYDRKIHKFPGRCSCPWDCFRLNYKALSLGLKVDDGLTARTQVANAFRMHAYARMTSSLYVYTPRDIVVMLHTSNLPYAEAFRDQFQLERIPYRTALHRLRLQDRAA